MKLLRIRTTIRPDSLLTTALIRYNGGYRISNKLTDRHGVHYWTSLETTDFKLARELYGPNGGNRACTDS